MDHLFLEVAAFLLQPRVFAVPQFQLCPVGQVAFLYLRFKIAATCPHVRQLPLTVTQGIFQSSLMRREPAGVLVGLREFVL